MHFTIILFVNVYGTFALYPKPVGGVVISLFKFYILIEFQKRKKKTIIKNGSFILKSLDV